MQSRYYDANIGRFINSDDSNILLYDVYNLFSYCNNNCVNFIDKSGCAPSSKVGATTGVNVTFSYTYNCYAYAMGEYGKWLIPSSNRKSIYTGNPLKNKYTCNDMANWVIKDFGSKVVRKLKNSKSKLKKGEYRIAFRIYKHYENGKFVAVKGFHFWKQDPNTKKWWEKPGNNPVNCIGKVNADSYKYWRPYDSSTTYMAVKRKFTKGV